jgi:hypothetical protein
MVGTADLGYWLVQLIVSQELHFVGCPPTADGTTGPLVPVEVEGTESPSGKLSRPAIIGHHHRLVGQTIPLLRWPLSRQLDSEGVIVFDNRCPCFSCHSKFPSIRFCFACPIIASLDSECNTRICPRVC